MAEGCFRTTINLGPSDVVFVVIEATLEDVGRHTNFPIDDKPPVTWLPTNVRVLCCPAGIWTVIGLPPIITCFYVEIKYNIINPSRFGEIKPHTETPCPAGTLMICPVLPRTPGLEIVNCLPAPTGMEIVTGLPPIFTVCS